MCNLSEAIEERGIEKGIARGIARGVRKGMAATINILRELGLTKEKVAQKVQQGFELTSEQTAEIMGEYWKE